MARTPFHLCKDFMCVAKWLLFVFRSKDLQSEAVDLRERIKHLNDMVFCQQRKVKGMIEEVRRVYLSVCETVQSHPFRPCFLLCVWIRGVDEINMLGEVVHVCLPSIVWMDSLHTRNIKLESVGWGVVLAW